MAVFTRTAARLAGELLHSQQPLGLAQLARALGVPISSAQRGLHALEELGIVVRDRMTRPRYAIAQDVPRDALRQFLAWQLRSWGRSPRSRSASDRVKLSSAAAAALPTVTRRLKARFHPLRIVVFGSQARGEADEDSDLDLLVVMPDGTARRSTTTAIYAALADLPIAKDVVVTTPAEIEQYGHLVGTVLRDALQEGLSVYEG